MNGSLERNIIVEYTSHKSKGIDYNFLLTVFGVKLTIRLRDILPGLVDIV